MRSVGHAVDPVRSRTAAVTLGAVYSHCVQDHDAKLMIALQSACLFAATDSTEGRSRCGGWRFTSNPAVEAPAALCDLAGAVASSGVACGLWCRYLASDGAPGRRDARSARPGRARSSVKAQPGREKPGTGGCGSHRAGARGESRCAAAGRRGPPRRGTAGQRSRCPVCAPRAALPVACRCHPALACTTAARRRGPAPRGKLSSCPAPTSCRNHPSRSLWSAAPCHGGPRPSRARRLRLPPSGRDVAYPREPRLGTSGGRP